MGGARRDVVRGDDEPPDADARSWLDEQVPFSSLELSTRRRSIDGTVKALFQTHDGHPVEAVLMRYRDGRRSVCVSSQSGCPLTCTFCATGQMHFRRNLDPWEILDQALHFRRIEPIDHVVFMGMGEPMLNIDAVLGAARRLPDIGVTHRRTTISTVGWLPGLTRFVDEVTEPIRLALSLHAAPDVLRSELMPVNDRFPLEDVLAECRRYVELRRRKVFVEYVMLAGVNDSLEHAPALAEVLDRHVFKVNLIPVQPDGHVRRLVAGPDRGVQGSARRRTAAVDHAADPRPRHRRRLRAAGRGVASFTSVAQRSSSSSRRIPPRASARRRSRCRSARASSSSTPSFSASRSRARFRHRWAASQRSSSR